MKERAGWVITLLVIMWAVFLVDAFHIIHLRHLGIIPRTTPGLVGIVTAPFIHANWKHLLGNSLPFLVLGLMTAVFYPRALPGALIGCALIGGSLVWLAGRHANHIGASGVIYGLAAFLIVMGLIKRQWLPLMVSVIVTVFYGVSMLTGLLPLTPGVSWESHVCGAIAGGLMARLLQKKG